MDVDVQKLIFEFIGGLGLFLFGIKYMGDGLQRSAGSRLRNILDTFTTNPILGILTGMMVTILIQSSSGTTVLTVGLVNAGLMTVRQAIGVVMGANIGTTVTAFIIGVDVSEYALPAIAVGTFLLFFFNNERIYYIGQVIFGLGGLFYGLKLMGGAMDPLRSFDAFHQLTVSMSDHPLLGVSIGTLFTVVVQSSSATIGILQALFDQSAISLHAALPVLFGDNIGTTITTMIASIGATIAAKRTALVHVMFNLIGAILALLLLVPFTAFVQYLEDILNLNPRMLIAFAHGSFNIVNTLILLPFIGVLAYVVTKVIPGKEAVIDQKSHLEPLLLEQSPSIALGQAHKETLRMGETSKEGLQQSYNYLKTNQKKHADKTAQCEEAINDFDRSITNYLVQLSSADLTQSESEQHSLLINVVHDIERIGDHMENIIELVDYKLDKKAKISESAMTDMNEMFQLTLSTLDEALSSLRNDDIDQANRVIHRDDTIDDMERTLRQQHIQRLNSGKCSGESGIVFVDILSNLERVGDHAVNIAQWVTKQ